MAEPLIQKSLTQVVLGGYSVGAATCITDPRILPIVQQYKRQVASQLIPVARHDISRRIPDARFFVSRKIDGEFNALVYRNGEMFTVNPGGTVRVGLPFFGEAKQLLDAAKLSDVIIPGELHVDLAGERRCRVHDAVSVLRHPRDQQEFERLRFSVFDLLSVNGESVIQAYAQTWKQIRDWFGGGHLVNTVETKVVETAKDVDSLFQSWVENESAEGIVVRSDSAGNFKLKPLFTIDAVVIGFTESSEDRTGLMHDLLLAVRRKDGVYHVLSRVGGGFTEDQRREMLSDLKDMVVESEYAEVNSDHVAYQMVRPEWVIEISCLDVIEQNTRGRPVNRMTLKYDESAGMYNVVRRMPLVSVISPQFLRIREDKSNTPSDVRIQQIDDIVPVPMADVEATELTLPKSTLMQREVYVKTLRGERLVRKFLLWKTNKENEAEHYPAYVAYHVDYSPSRKVPLSREVRVSSSETQILALWHELKEENIKKGWEPVGDVSSDIAKIVADAPGKDSKSGKKAVDRKPSQEKVAKASSSKKKSAKKTVKKKDASKKKAKTKKNSAKKESNKSKTGKKKKTNPEKKKVGKKKNTKKTKK